MRITPPASSSAAVCRGLHVDLGNSAASTLAGSVKSNTLFRESIRLLQHHHLDGRLPLSLQHERADRAADVAPRLDDRLSSGARHLRHLAAKGANGVGRVLHTRVDQKSGANTASRNIN